MNGANKKPSVVATYLGLGDRGFEYAVVFGRTATVHVVVDETTGVISGNLSRSGRINARVAILKCKRRPDHRLAAVVL